MTDREISQDELDKLVDDASYLQDEAEAMQYVIDTVPYDRTPPEGRSIAEMLLLIDHAQLAYYRPILEEAIDNPRPTHLDKFTHFKESFDPDEEKLQDVQNILKKLAKHRAGLVNAIKNVSLIDWETLVYKNESQVLLFDLIKEMIRFERSILKDIAEQVRIYNQEKQRQRDINEKKSQRQDQQLSER